MGDLGGQIKLNGLAELQATFKRLPDRLGDKVVMAALRAAGQVIRKEAQANAPVLETATKYRTPGTVRKNISVRKSKQNKFGVYVSVRPLSKHQLRKFRTSGPGKRLRKGAHNPNDPYYWWWVEFGTQNMPARPFMRPAFESKKFEALRKFEEIMKKRVTKEAEKLAREMGLKTA